MINLGSVELIVVTLSWKFNEISLMYLKSVDLMVVALSFVMYFGSVGLMLVALSSTRMLMKMNYSTGIEATHRVDMVRWKLSQC